MKKYILLAIMAVICLPTAFAQTSVSKAEGMLGPVLKWTFDGYALQFTNISEKGEAADIPNYDVQYNIAPWVKKKLNVKKVRIGAGINKIGSCAFANCANLQEVVFDGIDLTEIGWGAFYNCVRLKTISLPISLNNIETIAFAECNSLPSVKIPERCRVGDKAFASCTNIQNIELGLTTILGSHVFASEVEIDNVIRHRLYNNEIRKLPSYINVGNCKEYGFSRASVENYLDQRKETSTVDYDAKTSEVDKDIPVTDYARNDIYALVIGNQNYRFVGNVTYAIHDARVFAEYCQKTLGLPSENIHLVEDATKTMLVEEELDEWLSSIKMRNEKKLIVYYAGHGVPDIKDHNKAYILPVDVRGTSPHHGIALDAFYDKLGTYAFSQVSVFMDACFSGVNRNNEGVSENLRDVEMESENVEVNDGNLLVISAAQGNETAQGYPEEGHGLFTYYLLKELKETNGFVSFGSLSDNITKGVTQKAMQLKLRKRQTPKTSPSKAISEYWRNMYF